jgi:isopentenyl phosphate kinase
VVIGVDVDGLYDADPKEAKNAKLYTHLTLREVKDFQGKLGKSTAADVTGGMLGKVTELIPAIEQGIPVTIVNAAKSNRVYRALIGEKVEGTIIEKG